MSGFYTYLRINKAVKIIKRMVKLQINKSNLIDQQLKKVI